jgi:ribonuclease HI
VYTDAACPANQDPRLRRAGAWAFWSVDNVRNLSVPLQGDVQTNQIAELMGVLLVFRADTRPLEIRADSDYVLKACIGRLRRWAARNWRDVEYKELWIELHGIISGKPCGHYKFTEAKGHITWRHVKSGKFTLQDKLGNDFADFLARQGAEKHVIDHEYYQRITNIKRVTVAVQSMMIDIVSVRSRSMHSIAQQDGTSVSSWATDDSDGEGTDDPVIEVHFPQCDIRRGAVPILFVQSEIGA